MLLKLVSQYDWYPRSNDRKDLITTSFLLAKEFELRRFYYPVWLKRFHKLIPKTWEYWRNVHSDLETAHVKGMQLDQTMVDAAVMHPSMVVAKKVARSQKLSLYQLCWVLSRPFFIKPGEFQQEIVTVQQNKGVSSQDIAKAVSVSYRIREKLHQWYRRNKFPEFSDINFDGETMELQ